MKSYQVVVLIIIFVLTTIGASSADVMYIYDPNSHGVDLYGNDGEKVGFIINGVAVECVNDEPADGLLTITLPYVDDSFKVCKDSLFRSRQPMDYIPLFVLPARQASVFCSSVYMIANVQPSEYLEPDQDVPTYALGYIQGHYLILHNGYYAYIGDSSSVGTATSLRYGRNYWAYLSQYKTVYLQKTDTEDNVPVSCDSAIHLAEQHLIKTESPDEMKFNQISFLKVSRGNA